MRTPTMSDGQKKKNHHHHRQSRKGLIPAHAQRPGAAVFLWRGVPAVDVWRSAVWALSDGSANTSMAGSTGVGRQGRSRALDRHLASPYGSAAQKSVPFLGAGEASHCFSYQASALAPSQRPLSATIATLCELQWDPQGPVLWTTLDGAQFSLVADGTAADPRHLRREISAAIDQQLWARAAQHEQGKDSQQGVDWHAIRLHLTRLRKLGQHKEAQFLMACLTGALWPLQRQQVPSQR